MGQDEATECATCEQTLCFQWGDQHGCGVCTTCGTPYVIYHYDADDKPVKSPPTLYLNDKGMTLARAYWSETKRRVFPGVLDVGLNGRRGTTYSGATHSDISAWNEWMDSVGSALVPSEAA